MLIQKLDQNARTDQKQFDIDARSKVIKLINVQINTMLKISIVTTVKILVTQEAVEEEESSMGATFATETKVTIILIVESTHKVRAKYHHGIRNMEITVRELEWKALTTLN